jgi:hypothetical protein
MEHLIYLAKEFKREFGFDERIAMCLSMIVIAIIKYRTVNRSKWIPCL